MAEETSLTVAVLAAGQSRRFGEQDKLRVSFRGLMLGLHVVQTLPQLEIVRSAAHRIVVTTNPKHPCVPGWRDHGFKAVVNPDADEGMGTSVAQAARIARRANSQHLLIVLADMPLVPSSHYEVLVELAQSHGSTALVASSTKEAAMPPAVFGSDHFETLAALSGDNGARDLLTSGEAIQCPPDWLADIDTPEVLNDLQ